MAEGISSYTYIQETKSSRTIMHNIFHITSQLDLEMCCHLKISNHRQWHNSALHFQMSTNCMFFLGEIFQLPIYSTLLKRTWCSVTFLVQ